MQVLLTGLTIGLIFGFLFYFTEYFQEKYCMKCRLDDLEDIYISFVAGISVSYFFLELLPLLTLDFRVPSHEILTFFSILLGFTSIHIVETLILQRVESKTRTTIDELDKIRLALEKEEEETVEFIEKEIIEGEWDKPLLKKFAETASEAHKKEQQLKSQETDLKLKIEEHLNRDIDEVHAITNYFYHWCIGLLIFSLLAVDLLLAILFFIFTYLNSTISNASNRHVEIYGMNIHMSVPEEGLHKLILPSSVLVGVIAGFLFEVILPIPEILVSSLLAFISGIILYVIVREVIPEKTKGKPSFFLIGVILFSLAIILVYILE
jgi:hypothetical protein